MKIKLAMICFLLFGSIYIFSENLISQFKNNFYISKVDILLIRESPGQKSKILGRLKKGHGVKLLENTNIKETINNITGYWIKVNYDGIVGYIFNGYLEVAETCTDEEYNSEDKKLHDAFDKNKFKNYYEYYLFLEKNKINEFPNKIKRENDKLIINLLNDKTIELKDVVSNEKPENNKSFRFLNYYPKANMFLIEFFQYEVLKFIVINEKNGLQQEIWNKPYFSPSNKKFFCYGYGVALAPNGFQIWSIESDKFTLEITKNTDWWLYKPNWISENNIEFIKLNFIGPYIFAKTKGELLFQDSWQIIE